MKFKRALLPLSIALSAALLFAIGRGWRPYCGLKAGLVAGADKLTGEAASVWSRAGSSPAADAADLEDGLRKIQAALRAGREITLEDWEPLRGLVKEEMPSRIEADSDYRLAKAYAVEMFKKAAGHKDAIRRVVLDSAKAAGGEIVGLENEQKTVLSMTRKILSNADERYPRMSRARAIEKAGREIADYIRYSYVAPTPEFEAKGAAFLQGLRDAGYEILKIMNHFGTFNPCISVHLLARGGQKFQALLHTPESWEYKQKYHFLYEIARNPTVPKEVRAAADAIRTPLGAQIAAPPGADRLCARFGRKASAVAGAMADEPAGRVVKKPAPAGVK